MFSLKRTQRVVWSRRPRALKLGLENLEGRVVLSGTSIVPAVPAAAPSILFEPSYVVYHPEGTAGTAGQLNPAGESSGLPGTAYTPSQIRTAYGVNNMTFGSIAGDGTGQTIAIVDAYDNPDLVDSSAPNFSTSDLAEFDKQFGLPNPPIFTKYNEIGQTTNLPGTDPAGAGTGNWEVEEALDVEWVHAIAPGASIELVEANTSYNADLYTAVKTAASLPGVSVVSMSWGADEFNGESTYDSLFQVPGVTFLAASGDSGYPGHYPAYSPNVVAVGGTTLQNLDANGDYPGTGPSGEIAWSGSGGGISQSESEPSYQEGVQSTGRRTIPDVSFDANPNTGVAVYDSYNSVPGSIWGNNGPWEQVGGTSLATPSWAGVIAIANQGRVLAGGTPLTGYNQTLPALYSFQATEFHDITIGNNGGFNAGPGYDAVTGLGTPIANQLVPNLMNYGLPQLPGVYYPTTGTWYLDPNALAGSAHPITLQFGSSGSIPVAGDVLGTGKTEVGVYYPSTGAWYFNCGSSTVEFQFGFAGTLPVLVTLPGGSRAYPAIYYPTTGTWYVDENGLAGDANPKTFQFGFAGTDPVAGNLLGNGQTYVGIYNPSTGKWYVDENGLAGDAAPKTFQFGFAGTLPVLITLPGGSRAYPAVYNPPTGTWYVDEDGLAGDANPKTFQFGFAGTDPVAGDWNSLVLLASSSSSAAASRPSSSGSGQLAALAVLGSTQTTDAIQPAAQLGTSQGALAPPQRTDAVFTDASATQPAPSGTGVDTVAILTSTSDSDPSVSGFWPLVITLFGDKVTRLSDLLHADDSVA